MNPEPTAAPGGPPVSIGGATARSVVVLGAALVLLTTAARGGPEPVPAAVLALGTVLAVLRPATIGAWVALPAAAWVLMAGAGNHVGTGTALLAAAGGYLVHTGTAASAVFPRSAAVPASVGRRWLLRCLPAVVLTVVVAGVDAGIGTTPRSALFAVTAAGVVLLAAGLLFRLLTTRAGSGR